MAVAGCSMMEKPAAELSSMPLYGHWAPATDMARVQFTSDSPACRMPRFLSGQPAYTVPEAQAGVSLASAAAYDGGNGYGEAIHCYCYATQSPKDLSYGNHRTLVVSQIGNLTAGEMKVERDAFFNTSVGTRYEFEGSFPSMGSMLKIYGARDSGQLCSISNVVAWNPKDKEAADRALKFIATNASEPAGGRMPNFDRSAAASRAPDERLRQLQRLRDEGLISEQEYAEKRKAILDQL